MAARYIAVHQAQTRPPTAYDNALGDAIEAAFGQGIHNLPGLVAALNQAGIATPEGAPWTEQNLAPVMNALAEAH